MYELIQVSERSCYIQSPSAFGRQRLTAHLSSRETLSKVLEIADKVTAICMEPLRFEAILQWLFTGYGLTMNFEQYVLVGSTVRSYLAWLKDTGRVNGLFENNMLLWQRT